MPRCATGLADLLMALEATPPARWPAVAAALGWQATDHPAPAPLPSLAPAWPAPRPTTAAPTAEPTAAPPAAAPAEPAQGVPRQVHWRVAAHTTDPEAQADIPDWLLQGEEPTEAEFEGDLAAVPPPLVPLVRPGQVATFLRRHLARERPTPEPDLPAVLRALVRQQPLLRVPRRLRRRWPARVQLVLDRAPALGPLHEDLLALAVQASRLLGPRAVLRLAVGEPAGWLDAAGEPAALPADGGPVLVLGDAGLVQPGGTAQPRWVALARRLAAAGCRPLLLAPLPRRLAQRDTAAAFDTVLLGAGRAMRIVHAGRLPAAGVPAAAPSAAMGPAPPGTAPGSAAPPGVQDLQRATAATPSPRPPQAPPAPPALAVLRTALYGNPWVTPALLRALRLALQAQGLPLDAGHEAELWRDPAVSAHGEACTLLAGQRAAAARDWAALPAGLQADIVATHHRHLRAGDPLLLHEYNATVWPLLRPGAEAAARAQSKGVRHGLPEAEAFARRVCAALWRAGGARWSRGLAAFVGRLGQRRPELFEQGDDALQAAWLLAHRDALRHGVVQPLPGLRLSRLAWALGDGDEAGAAPQALALWADTSAGPAVPATMVLQWHAAAAPGARAAALAARATHLPAAWSRVAAKVAGDEAPSPAAAWLPAGGRLALPPRSTAVELRCGAHILSLEPFTRPEWARALRHERSRWQAQAADGRWLTWVPQCAVQMTGATPPPRHRPQVPGAWWHGDAALQHTPPAHHIPRLPWASAQGIDATGPWAEFSIAGPHGSATQRLRWLPAGEFWMGSPEDEPDRSGNEQRHRVVLTQGLWLADAACTQALWQAVLGKNPSRFSDDPENPVEQVSWVDVTQRFLPALNARVPGLQAVLPTEAQWEYGCRAGTETPFWFGGQVTTVQVNYDGNSPYAGGPQGEYRQRTVPVKALPANGWGLYQMHGNVYEWCADEYGKYPEGPVIDPHRLPAGGRGAHDAQGNDASKRTRGNERAMGADFALGAQGAGGRRVLRGGSWSGFGRGCRSANRLASGPGGFSGNVGFRLARGLAEPGPEAQPGGAGFPRAEPAGPASRAERGSPPEAASRPPPVQPPTRSGGRRR